MPEEKELTLELIDELVEMTKNSNKEFADNLEKELNADPTRLKRFYNMQRKQDD